MKAIFILISLLSINSFAHDHSKHEELKTEEIVFNGDSIFNLESHWIDINGKHVTLSKLKGKPFLAAMIYTTCTGACPMIVKDMKKLVRNLPEKKRLDINLVVFSFDPKRDTPEALKKFAANQEMEMRQSYLFTPMNEGGARELASVLGVQFKKAGDEFIHSNVIYLVDKDGVIISKKDGLNKKSADFEEEIVKILK